MGSRTAARVAWGLWGLAVDLAAGAVFFLVLGLVLTQRDGALRLEVTDDGRGFDPETTSYGTGLQGIADRLAAIGGTLRLQSQAGRGTMLAGTVPVQEPW